MIAGMSEADQADVISSTLSEARSPVWNSERMKARAGASSEKCRQEPTFKVRENCTSAAFAKPPQKEDR
jgi:hypothetical protein